MSNGGEHASLLRDAYGLSGDLTPLPGENDNVLVTTGDAQRFVLKVMRNASLDDLELERTAVDALRTRVASLAVPSLVPTKAGDTIARTSNGTFAQLLSFVDGTPWGEAGDATPARCRALGQTLATVAAALRDVEHSPRTHRWDLARAAQNRPLVTHVNSPAQRRALDEAFALHAAYAPFLNTLPRGLIHGDANDENVLVEGDDIVGLLDFGDCLVNPLVCEVAIALAYVMQRSTTPWDHAADVVAGYHDSRVLSNDELDVLFPLIVGRLAVTVSTCAERRTIDAARTSWFASEDSAWRALLEFVDVAPLDARARLSAGIDTTHTAPGASPNDLIKARRQHINPALSLAYDEPLKIVRGRGAHLFDHRGRPYLDLVNNVCHVGHCHPHVVEAGQRQMAQLNTNTRYLHDGLTEYAERLCATLPPELDTCFFVNSGSEANELAVRLARAHTGRRDMLIVDGAYHGHTSTLIDLSPYKFMGRGGRGTPESWVHVVPVADVYRGAHRGPDAGQAYGDDVGRAIEASPNPVAAFMSESLLGCGGQVIPPHGYFTRACEHVRAAGGLFIADEVQVGFGRVGTHFWAFQREDVVPDIVVMGKPIGNGHPMAAVVARREIAESFNNGMEFFATFGGNPVSCAIGSAVLDVIENEGLQHHALELGKRMRGQLGELAERHPLIGDVRGVGLFQGVELVRDHTTLEPAADAASAVVDAMSKRGFLLSTDGPLANVLKIKPPMVLTGDDVDRTVRALDEVFDTLVR